MIVLLVMIQEFYCTNTREYTNGFLPVHSLLTLWNNVNETTGMFHSKGYVLCQKNITLAFQVGE